jgi:DNA invertase Pin-like site-specific DNA recombinase
VAQVLYRQRQFFTKNGGIMNKRCALYARVSTNNGQQDPEMQLAELREYAARRDLVVSDEYVDHVSGSKDSRPALNRLMADAHARKFDTVLVWKIDRWGRSLKHLVTSLADLDAYGVAFVSLRDSLDLSTPSGRLMMQLLGAMAEFERALIVERVRAGLMNARNKGRKLGRPRLTDLTKASRVTRWRRTQAMEREQSANLDCHRQKDVSYSKHTAP